MSETFIVWGLVISVAVTIISSASQAGWAFLSLGVIGEEHARAGALWIAVVSCSLTVLFCLYELFFGSKVLIAIAPLLFAIERLIQILARLSLSAPKKASAKRTKRAQ